MDNDIFFDDSDDPGWVEFRERNRKSGVFVSGPWEPEPAFVKPTAPKANPHKDAFDYLVATLKHHHTKRPGIREAIRRAEAIAEGKQP